MKKYLMILLFIAFLNGCQTAEPEKINVQQKTKNIFKVQQIYDPQLVKKAEQIGKQVNGVDSAVSVVLNKDVSIALKVTGFSRFQMQSIKKQVAQEAKKQFPKDCTIHISTDKKIYRELEQLQSDLEQGEKTPEELNKQLKKINKSMHG